MLKSKKGVVVALVFLCICNICLDYAAVCTYFDVDMFSGIGVKHILALAICIGCSLTLYVLPKTAAEQLTIGSKNRFILCLGVSLTIALILATLRAVADASKTIVTFDGSIQSQMNLSDIVFVVVMFSLAVGEILTSFFFREFTLLIEYTRVKACITQLKDELENVTNRIELINKVTIEQKKIVASAAKSAADTFYITLLDNSNGLQSTTLNYVQAINAEKARFNAKIDELLCSKDGAVTFRA